MQTIVNILQQLSIAGGIGSIRNGGDFCKMTSMMMITMTTMMMMMTTMRKRLISIQHKLRPHLSSFLFIVIITLTHPLPLLHLSHHPVVVVAVLAAAVHSNGSTETMTG